MASLVFWMFRIRSPRRLGWDAPMRASIGIHSHDRARLWISVQVRCQQPRNGGDARCAGSSRGTTAAACRAAGTPRPDPLAIPCSRAVMATRSRPAYVARRVSRCADTDMVPTMPRWTVHESCTPASADRWGAPNGMRQGSGGSGGGLRAAIRAARRRSARRRCGMFSWNISQPGDGAQRQTKGKPEPQGVFPACPPIVLVVFRGLEHPWQGRRRFCRWARGSQHRARRRMMRTERKGIAAPARERSEITDGVPSY